MYFLSIILIQLLFFHHVDAKDEIFSKEGYVTLDEDEGRYIESINEMEVLDNGFIVVLTSNDYIYMYDNTGQFIEEVSRPGEGPGEVTYGWEMSYNNGFLGVFMATGRIELFVVEADPDEKEAAISHKKSILPSEVSKIAPVSGGLFLDEQEFYVAGPNIAGEFVEDAKTVQHYRDGEYRNSFMKLNPRSAQDESTREPNHLMSFHWVYVGQAGSDLYGMQSLGYEITRFNDGEQVALYDFENFDHYTPPEPVTIDPGEEGVPDDLSNYTLIREFIPTDELIAVNLSYGVDFYETYTDIFTPDGEVFKKALKVEGKLEAVQGNTFYYSHRKEDEGELYYTIKKYRFEL